MQELTFSQLPPLAKGTLRVHAPVNSVISITGVVDQQPRSVGSFGYEDYSLPVGGYSVSVRETDGQSSTQHVTITPDGTEPPPPGPSETLAQLLDEVPPHLSNLEMYITVLNAGNTDPAYPIGIARERAWLTAQNLKIVAAGGTAVTIP